MKVKLNTDTNKGFTLIEMIGVLAVIAILAALLIPKVFQAITEARINTVPVGCATAKTAAVDNYAKFGSLINVAPSGTAWGSAPADGAVAANYDDLVLMVGGFLDKPFAPRVGTAGAADIKIANITTAVALAAGNGLAWDLDGNGTADVTGTHVVFAEIPGVVNADAQAISARIDGTTMSSPENSPGTADTMGRVKYAGGSTGSSTVYIYLTHR